MSDKFKNKFRIPSARLQHWDYGSNGEYFITICTQNRIHYFGEIENGEMKMSRIGIIADVLWHEIKNHFKHIELGAFVVMPNHIHGIIMICENDIENRNSVGVDIDDETVETTHALSLQPSKSPGQQRFQNQGKNTISSIIGSYKSAISKHAHRLGLDISWQPRFYDHIIRDSESFHRISNYIINNPSNWQRDKFFRNE